MTNIRRNPKSKYYQINPNFQYYQYYQINPNFKIPKEILDLGFGNYLGFGNIGFWDF